jgi:adenylate kinase family enzyme
MGPTGAGKSTLASKFGKLRLKSILNENTDEWAIIHQDDVNGPKIADPNNVS